MIGAFVALIWSLISGISSFRNVPFFNSNKESSLGTLYIVLGCIFMAIVAIEVFGMFAAASRRLAAVRTFAYLSILATLLVAATYVIQTVIHYKFKNDIIDVCTNINTGDRIFFTGFFGPVDGGVVTPFEALEWCNRQYNHNSLSNIVALLLVTAVAIIFAFFVFAYLRQLRDPTSPANFSRDPVALNNINNNNVNTGPYGPYGSYGSYQPYGSAPPPIKQYDEPFKPSKAPSYHSNPPAYDIGNNFNDVGNFGDQKRLSSEERR